MSGEIHEVIYNPETGDWTPGDVLAVRGWPGCKSLTCTRRGDFRDSKTESVCIGWHCPRCGKPTDAQGGHQCAAPSTSKGS